MDSYRRTKVLLCASITILGFSACSTPGRSIGAGAGSGVLLGAGVSALADPGEDGHNRVRNVIVGSAIGGVVGAGVGFAADRLVKDERNESYEKGKKDGKQEITAQAASVNGHQPRLMPAKTEARWVPDQVHGNTFVPGHFEYHILENSRWENSQ